MSSHGSVVKELTAMLREIGAQPRLSADRVVRSTMYDLDYRVAIIACVFFVAGEKRLADSRSLVAHWLKILQFIAVRPALLLDFQCWAKARRCPDLDTWQKMPRGYLGDNTHDQTVELLIAGGILTRIGDELVGGERFEVLQKLYQDIVAKDLLRSERDTLFELSKFRANKTLLKGE